MNLQVLISYVQAKRIELCSFRFRDEGECWLKKTKQTKKSNQTPKSQQSLTLPALTGSDDFRLLCDSTSKRGARTHTASP